MRGLTVVFVLAMATPAVGQIVMRATEPPLVTASNEAWYQLREPIQFAGELYYPAGAAVFFNGNEMVRTGYYNGVPLYANTTMDPYSVVFVPVGSGQMQPYERLRRGDLAGTTGSRTPSFPIALLPDTRGALMAPMAPTGVPLSIGAIGAYAVEAPAAIAIAATPAVCTCGDLAQTTAAVEPPPIPRDVVSVLSARRPDNNDGLWVRFAGQTWISRGMAEPRTNAFEQVGEHAGFPVYRKAGAGDGVIYLPARSGLVAPYRRKI